MSRLFAERLYLTLARVTAQYDRQVARREAGGEERVDSDGGREQGRVTANPSEALLSLFNYHPSLALPITPVRARQHRESGCELFAHQVCAYVCSVRGSGHGPWHRFLVCF